MEWTTIRIRKSTLRLINKIKADLEYSGKTISKDEIINTALELIRVKKNGRNEND